MSLCLYANLTIPIPSFDLVALVKALLALLGIPLPPMPTIPFPAFFCVLD